MPSAPLRIGYVPEHFSTPLFLAQKHYGLDAKLISFPSGTGHMVTALRAGEIDVAIGLTEGWIAGLGKEGIAGDGGYRLVGSYVETPLCWAISTGAQRTDLSQVDQLRGGRVGVSRIGSGSHVMSFVLADQHGWPAFSDTIILDNFEKLRRAVNSGEADFFMWETFTSKKYHDSGEIRRLGDILTPWSSWKIVASTALAPRNGSIDPRINHLFELLDQGIKHFNEHQDEAVQYIVSNLGYSKEDALRWLPTVEFASSTKGVNARAVTHCINTLQQAGVLVEGKGMKPEEMVVEA